MKPIIHGSTARLAKTLGLVAGTWLILSAAAPGAEAFLSANSATAATDAAAGADRIHLAQADAERPVTYSSDQADEGEEKFARECEECHGDDLKGGLNGGAPLRGLVFEEKYFGELPASILFGFMSSTMPPNSPGRFSPSIYADLMAYILKRNGFRPGAPLPSDLDALDLLMMVK